MEILSLAEKLQRIICREFLIEPGLYLEMGLETLPSQLAPLLGCAESDAVAKLVDSPHLEPLSLEELESLLAIRDMTIISRTAAALSAELKDPGISYHHCCRVALCYAVIERLGHVYSALRAAAGKNDAWARHHYFYGLILGMEGNIERALWELGMALQYEPYEEGKIRIRWALDLLEE